MDRFRRNEQRLQRVAIGLEAWVLLKRGVKLKVIAESLGHSRSYVNRCLHDAAVTQARQRSEIDPLLR
jgi:hypothetical protein